MKLGQNAMAVLERRYVTRDEQGNVIESVEELFRRVAKAVASADMQYDENADLKAVEQEFYDMMTGLEFLPNSPTLMNAGKELGQLSACFVLPVEDSMEDIFEAIKQAALIHKSGGGTGFSFSRLRPQGSTVKSTGGIASGPISFMKVFNMATEAVKQGGTRRGANMGILRVDHPDIMDFIDCKKDNADITNFNISIGITEKFMEAAENGQLYDLIDPVSKKPVGTLEARKVFDKIVCNAWSNGEPGIIFLDRLNRDNPVPCQGEIESTNPCGEQPLLPYESCNLGSINLVEMVKTVTDGRCEVDFDKLEAVVHKAVHFLDNVIDINRYPLERIETATKLTRKIGLGVMGFADLLLRMQIPYNSDEGAALGEKIMELVQTAGHEASRALAKKREAFPLFSQSIYKGQAPLRNATVTTIAPTGTLSIIAGCSSGVEPVFAFVYVRNIMDNTRLMEVNPYLRQVLEERGIYTEALMEKINSQGTLAHIEEIPEDIRSVFVCAHDVSPQHHVRMQAAFQKNTDNAVSKTVNFGYDCTLQDVEQAFKLAYQLGCKGTTIYRDGSRDNQTLSTGKTAVAGKEASGTACSIKPRPRPESMMGVTKRMSIGCGNLYVTVNYDSYGICEVFTSTGKAGGCPSQSEATARLASIALRSGLDADQVIRQLRGIRCPSTVGRKGVNCTSCPDAIAQVLREVRDNLQTGNWTSHLRADFKFCPKCGKALPDGDPVCLDCGFGKPSSLSKITFGPSRDNPRCPDCGETLEHEGGCVSCPGCGFSKCG